jgi:hypothetical protein
MRALPTLDEAKALGAQLRLVDPSLLKPVPWLRRWFRGPEAYLECTVDEDDDGLVRIELYVRGRYARWTKERGLETGTTDEGMIDSGAPQSHIEARDRAAEKSVVDVARAMVEANADLAKFARYFAS